MHKVRRILLDRVEGATGDLRRTAVKSFTEANAVLLQWSRTAPKTLGYHKCDVVIEWEGGVRWKHRHDLVHYSVEHPRLHRDVQDQLGVRSGLKRPDWITRDDEWAAIQEHFADSRQTANTILETCSFD